MIFCYNKKAVGDTLLIIAGDAQGKEVASERKGNIVRVAIAETNQTVAWNIFQVSHMLGEIEKVGQLSPTKEEIAKINEEMATAGFDEKVEVDTEPKIVTGFVQTCKKHPDSDHLSITQVDVGEEETLQIVCGAPNIKAGLKVVVAKPGAMMPDGLMIWPGKLRGVESFGMICSARELKIPNAPAKRGILELPFDAEIGQTFQIEEMK